MPYLEVKYFIRVWNRDEGTLPTRAEFPGAFLRYSLKLSLLLYKMRKKCLKTTLFTLAGNWWYSSWCQRGQIKGDAAR